MDRREWQGSAAAGGSTDERINRAPSGRRVAKAPLGTGSRRMRLLCAALVAVLPTSVSCFAVSPRVAPRQPLVAAPAATAPSSVDAVRAKSARSKRRRWSAAAVGTDADDVGTEILVEIKGGIQVC